MESSASARTATLSATAIPNLPINGRRFQDFVTLTPTAQVDASRGQLSLAGQRGINTNISIDGADYNQPFFGGIRGGERCNFAPTVPQESIQEFQVVASGYSAEFGRSSGGLVNAVTKSGSNNWHGSRLLPAPRQGLGEPERLDQDAAFAQHQFGASSSGPLPRTRPSSSLAYEQQGRRTRARAVQHPDRRSPPPAAAGGVRPLQGHRDALRGHQRRQGLPRARRHPAERQESPEPRATPAAG